MKKWMQLSICSLFASAMAFSNATPLFAQQTDFSEQTVEESSRVDGIEIVPFKILGEDDRTQVSDVTQAPYNTLAKILITFNNGTVSRTYFSSGFLIDDSNILTAGHSVFDPDYGQVTRIQIAIGGGDKTKPVATYELGPEAIHVNPAYAADNNQHGEDFGLIHLDKPVTGITKFFKLADEATINSLIGNTTKVELAGYTNHDASKIDSLVPWTATGNLVSGVQNEPKMVLHNIDTQSGQSGSPIFIEKDGEYQVVAIHINALTNYEANGALKINPSVISLIRAANPTQQVEKAVYRAYNPNSGEHFFTPDYTEFRYITSIGWNDEGIAWMTEDETKGEPLYRLYNPNSGLHHYTSDTVERDALVELGWNDEDVAWYASIKPTDTAVYRLYNQYDGQHHYTADVNEKNTLVSLGWDDEGVGYRTAPVPTK